MVAALTVWILVKGLFFMTIILGPIALIGLAIDNRLKDRPNYKYVTMIMRFFVTALLITALAVTYIWLGWHHKMGWGDWLRACIIILIVPGLWQDGRKLRLLTTERRQARTLAEAEDNKPSEFHYASDRSE